MELVQQRVGAVEGSDASQVGRDDDGFDVGFGDRCGGTGDFHVSESVQRHSRLEMLLGAVEDEPVGGGGAA